MVKSLFCFSRWKLTSVAFAGMTLMLIGHPLAAQTKDKDTQKKDAGKVEQLDAPRAKQSTLLRTGYTRPGNPSDMIKEGKVVPVAWDDDYKGRYMGGTVYFAVYEQTGLGTPGDVFGTGFAGIDELFKEGRATSGQYSPAFDTNARFLYVYQVVNDRGLDPVKEVPIGAAWRSFRTEDIVSASVKLLVDPRELTSWGHFSGAAFVSRVVDRDFRGKEQLAADGKTGRTLLMSLSSNPSVLESLPYHEYLTLSPALPLHNLKNDFAMERSNLNLKNSKAYKELADLKSKGTKLVSWQENVLSAAKGGMEPTYVQLYGIETPSLGHTPGNLYFDTNGLPEVLPVGQNPPRGYVKVDWSGDQIVKLGDHSVVFGFTTNLPPTDEVVRLISAPKVGAGEHDAAMVALIDGNGPGVGHGQVVAPGTVPTPMCMPAPDVGSGFWLGVPAVGFGGGGGGGFVAGGGFFVGPRAPFIGGGAAGGTSGAQNQAQTQFQAQAQTQTQSQTQQQTPGGSTPPGNVVPEPAAIALGLIGLPALYFALRRRKASKLSLSQA